MRIFFAACLVLLLGQQMSVPRPGVLSPVLLHAWADEAAAPQPVYILLREQVDAALLDKQWQAARWSQAQRVARLIDTLQTTADRSQADLLDWLHSQPGVAQIQPYWIHNLVRAEVAADLLAALSQRPEVAQVLPVPAVAPDEARPAPLLPPTPAQQLTGVGALRARGYTGAGRRLLVIDTGVDGTHPALRDNYHGRLVPADQAWLNPGQNDVLPGDCSGHGTHVAGIAVGLEAATQDTIGIAYRATWMAAPAIKGTSGPCVGTPGPDPLSALQWALDPDGNPGTTDDMPDVINNSWSGIDTNCAAPLVFAPVLNALEAAGIAVIFSAGNRGNVPDTAIGFPANINSNVVNSFAVGAIDHEDPSLARANFSSVGPTVCDGAGSLLIKPEVVAPGVRIRSATRGGGYTRLSGTSMSAPHVAGLVLLLKEAFPYLSGKDLLLALYYTATDLGDPGEDNAYGMGLVNVQAAYDNLVAAGHVPVVPPTGRDIALQSLDLATTACDSQTQVLVRVVNRGTGTLLSMRIAYAFDTQLRDTLAWTGSLPAGQSLFFPLPVQAFAPGIHQVEAAIISENGLPPYYFLDNRLSLTFTITRAPGLVSLPPTPPVCPGADALLAAGLDGVDPTVQLYWWTASDAGTLLGRGANLLLPAVDTAGVYYASAYREQRLGLADNLAGGGIYSQATDPYLRFDVRHPVLLRSVKVYSVAVGTQIVQLRDAQSNVLATRTVETGIGEYRLALDIALPVGTDLRLGLAPGSAGGLYYNLTGFQFPYETPDGFVRITGGAGPQPDRYYYFYDWELAYEVGCGRLPVVVRLGSGEMTADFSADRQTVDLQGQTAVQFTDQSSGAVAWCWYFGDGGTATVQHPVHAFYAVGHYPVALVATSADGCADADTLGISVLGTYPYPVGIATPDAALRWTLHPNPGNGRLHLVRRPALAGQVQVRLYDLHGRLLWSRPAPGGGTDLSLPPLAPGVYLLEIDEAAHRSVIRYLHR
ncbi:MAG: hypothetical protein OHK0039_38390 [Bacteroidia bacterium]